MTTKSRILSAYMRYLEDDEKSQNTIELYMRGAHRLCSFLESQDISFPQGLNKHGAVLYKKSLEESGLSAQSCNAYIAAFNSLALFLKKPECKLRAIKVQRTFYQAHAKSFSKADYKRMLRASKDNTKYFLIMQTLAATGIRVSEIRFVTVDAVLLGKVTIKLKGKLRYVPLPDKLKQQLSNYIKQAHISSGPVFVSSKAKPLNRSVIWRTLKCIAKQAGVALSKVFPHNFRHLFAKSFNNAFSDLSALATILGHTNIGTTRIYMEATFEEYASQINRLGLVT